MKHLHMFIVGLAYLVPSQLIYEDFRRWRKLIVENLCANCPIMVEDYVQSASVQV